MSVFSEKLYTLFSQSNMTVTALAKLSGVERSYLQKLLSGTRKPKPEVVGRLADALMLPPEERHNLKKSFSITQMGEAVYYRRLLVKRLIEDTESYTWKTHVNYATPLPVSKSKEPVQAFQGKASVTDTLHLFLAEELAEESPELSALIQPDCEAASILRSYCWTRQDLSLQHIICFDSGLPYQKENHHNLTCMRALIPFLLGSCRYSGWFYYDITEPPNRIRVLPWFILGRSSVLSISQDNEKAILYRDPRILELYQRIFREIQNECRPLFEVENLLPEQFWNSTRWPSNFDKLAYSLQYDPCWGMFYTMDMVNHLLRQDVPNREQILFFFSQRQKQISLLEGERSSISFFTEEGLDDFLRTGRISEIPDELYDPIPRTFQIQLLQRMLTAVKKGCFFPYIIRSPHFRISRQLSFFIGDDQRLSCSCQHPVHGTVSVMLHEKSIVYSICDFMEYLRETDLVYSLEETTKILQNKLQQLRES